jgi:hypothetical protein
LGDDLAIKGIPMLQRQREEAKRVVGGVGSDVKVEILNRLLHTLYRKSQLTDSSLDRYLR